MDIDDRVAPLRNRDMREHRVQTGRRNGQDEGTVRGEIDRAVREVEAYGALRFGDNRPEATVELDGAFEEVGVGTAVFIPSNAIHTIMNTGTAVLRILYTFPTDEFGDVFYEYLE